VSEEAPAERAGPATPTGQRDQAVGALFGYGFLLLIRMAGISELLFEPNPRNPLTASPIHEVGVFLFYDAFVLVILAFLASAYLVTRYVATLGIDAGTARTLDTLATVALSGSSLLLILGIVVQVLG
jgi:hypothetical protein